MTELSNVTGPLAELIKKLESNPEMNNQIVLDLLKQANLTHKDIEPYSFYDHPATESYGRLGVYQSNRLRVFVLSWNKGDFTAIHDHEPAEWGAVQFFGDLAHRLYSVEGDQVILKQSGIIHPGTSVGVTGSLVHAMGNLSDKPALTLHLYGTNTADNQGNARVFDLEMGLVVMTEGAAYLSRSDSEGKILPGQIFANAETMEDYLENTRLWRAKLNG